MGWSRVLILPALLVLLLVACAAEPDGEPADDPKTGLGPDQAAATETAGFAGWSEAEMATLESLWLGSLPPLAPDPSNAVGDDPRAAALGQRIFFDTRFSAGGNNADGSIACATCHVPTNNFTDSLPRSQALGTTPRHTPTIVGAAYYPWFFWDGRRDSQWAQVLGPLEAALEHGGSRTQYAHLIHDDPEYRADYEAIFGPMPDLSDGQRFPAEAGPVDDPQLAAAWEGMDPADRQVINQVFANIGKAVAAYERQIMPGASEFDAYVAALLERDEAAMAASLSADEVAGLRLFVGRGNCTQCHNGPLFTNMGFHSIGMPDAEGQPPDVGRFAGVQLALDNEFNCLGQYSDAEPEECEELRFAKTMSPELMAAFKVPTLRNVAQTAPYMHAGQFATLEEVLDHYNQAPSGLGPTAHTDLAPLGLTAIEMDQLEAFLGSLTAPLDVEPALLAPP
ncbi:MAG: cytochrome-c peroxidase [Chloroflexota bacterium]|nr:MAG: cytochrome-c peroxidase [Chloroflexota bacterium]